MLYITMVKYGDIDDNKPMYSKAQLRKAIVAEDTIANLLNLLSDTHESK